MRIMDNAEACLAPAVPGIGGDITCGHTSGQIRGHISERYCTYIDPRVKKLVCIRHE